MTAHETYLKEEKVEGSSNRVFGLVFTAFFSVIGLWPLFKGGEPRVWALIVAGIFLALALIVPCLLAPLNKAWMKFGIALSKITNPIVMSVLCFVVITPFALVMRLLGKDPLKRRFESDKTSYWIERNPAGPTGESMRHQ